MQSAETFERRPTKATLQGGMVSSVGNERFRRGRRRTRERPENDEADSHGPGSGVADLGLVRVDREVGPDDILLRDLEVASRHAKWRVVGEASMWRGVRSAQKRQEALVDVLSEHVGSDLLVELNEGGRLGGVLLVRSWASEDGALLLNEASSLGDLLASPLDRVDPVRADGRSGRYSPGQALRSRLTSLRKDRGSRAYGEGASCQ